MTVNIKLSADKPKMPTPDMIQAAEAVLLARGIVASVKEVVERYQSNILLSMGFDGVKMLHRTYEMTDDEFAVYNDRCKKARDAAGFVVDNDDFCPLLVAENNLRKTERKFATLCCEFCYDDITVDDLLCQLYVYKRFIDVNLQWITKFIL